MLRTRSGVGGASGPSKRLREARELLSGTEGIAFCGFTDEDVVRHPLVQKIIVAYEKRDRESEERKAAKAAAIAAKE